MQNALDERLNGLATESWDIYYGFNQITRLLKPMPLSSLRRYPTGTVVHNAVPGSCVVEAPTDVT